MTDQGIASLPVVDDLDRVVGIVSEIDLIGDRMPEDDRFGTSRSGPLEADPSREVRDVMTTAVACLGGGADTADLAALMKSNNIRAVPIVEGSRLVGIASRRDLLRTLVRNDGVVWTDVLGRIRDYTGVNDSVAVEVHNCVVTTGGRFDEAAREAIIVQLTRTVPDTVRSISPGPGADAGWT